MFTKPRNGWTDIVLDDFEGLGQKRKDALLQYFGSIAKIKLASVEKLSEVEGIGLQTAKNLREFLDKLHQSE